MIGRYVILNELVRRNASAFVATLPIDPEHPVELIAQPYAETRTKLQNKKLWPMLADVSKQVDWYPSKLTKEEWKDVFTASLRQQKVVRGLDGGFVMVGSRTSTMSKREFGDLIELIYAFGVEHDVAWSEKAIEAYEQYREAA